MRRIGVSGYFGYGNLGDEWFLQTWRALFAGAADVQHLHPLDDPRTFDAVIVGGGDLVTNTVSNHYWRPELMQRPCWAYGIGVQWGDGVSPETAETYQRLLSACRNVTARDDASQHCLQAIGVQAHVAEDIAWGGPLPPAMRPSDGERPWFGMSVRPAPRLNIETWADLGLRYWDAGFLPVAMPLQVPAPPGLDDYGLHLDLQAAIVKRGGSCHVLPPDMDTTHRLAAIGACAVYATMRFHGAIAGLRYHVPTAALCMPWANKFQQLNARLGATVASTSLFEVARLLLEPPSDVDLIEAQAAAELMAFRDVVLSTL